MANKLTFSKRSEKAYEQIQYNISVLSAGMSFKEVSEKCWKIPDEFLSHRYTTLIHGVDTMR